MGISDREEVQKTTPTHRPPHILNEIARDAVARCLIRALENKHPRETRRENGKISRKALICASNLAVGSSIALYGGCAGNSILRPKGLNGDPRPKRSTVIKRTCVGSQYRLPGAVVGAIPISQVIAPGRVDGRVWYREKWRKYLPPLQTSRRIRRLYRV